MNENQNAYSATPPDSELRREAERRLRNLKSTPTEGTSEAEVRALVHELEVHQIELEMQNEELQRTQAAAIEASDKYLDLFDFAPVAYFLWDHEGRVLEVNLAGAALLGLDRNMVVQRRFDQFLAPDHRATFADFCRRVALSDTKHTCEVAIVNGEETVDVQIDGITVLQRAGPRKVCRAAIVDITQQKRANETLRKNETRLRLALDAAHLAVWEWDVATGNVVWNDEYYRILGHEPGSVPPPHADLADGVRPEDISGTDAALRQTLAEDGEYAAEYKVCSSDGTMRVVESHGRFDRDTTGKAIRSHGVMMDITEHKRAEAGLQSSLDDKEVLLKEIHHRVKNNMQVICSLLALHAQRASENAMREVLYDATHRVRSMALVHEKLYQSADLERIEFADYARSLLSYLWRSHGTIASDIRLVLDLEPVPITVNAAVPCGLILNELVSNVLKHAFRDLAGGEVIVSLRRGSEGQVSLRVRDNGKGLPAGFDWRQAESLGLHLVQLLAEQLHATVEVTSAGGTEFAVTLGKLTS